MHTRRTVAAAPSNKRRGWAGTAQRRGANRSSKEVSDDDSSLYRADSSGLRGIGPVTHRQIQIAEEDNASNASPADQIASC